MSICSVSFDTNINLSGFFMTLKLSQTPEETAVVRHIAQKYFDIGKTFKVHKRITLCPSSMSSLVSVAKVSGFHFFFFA